MIALRKNESKFEWTGSCEKSFQEIKDRLNPGTYLPKCSENYTVYCDSSRVGLGCVLI